MISQDELRVKISELVSYACDKISLNAANKIYVTNQLLDFFSLTYPAPIPDKFNGDFQQDLITPLVEYAIESGMTTAEEALLFETKLLGKVTPTPAEIIEQFDIIASNKGCDCATDWFFNLSKANNYIRMLDINRNIKWSHTGKFGDIDITINLSKPERILSR